MATPKVFISYSWDSDSHKKWVADLATRLRNDGIETILDQWHLVPGDQLTAFMEHAIHDNDYVLVICTPEYQQKSNERKGGVGYEGDIMTAEVFAQRNHHKFIPILARGTWKESAPIWLRGKHYVDLTKPDEREYQNLTITLLGTRTVPPPVQKQSSQISQRTDVSVPLEPIRIEGIILDQVTEPRLDGTHGSALYSIPFRLSRRPSSLWADLFVKTWNWPPVFTSMHRPGIASVSGDTIVLDGTTMEEVKNYHRDTLVLCVNKANEEEARILEERHQKELRRQQMSDKHRRNVDDISKDIKF